MNSHEGGDAAQRLRCTHLSFDYARGKYPERVQEDHTISQKVPLRSGGAGGSPPQGVKGDRRRTFSTPRLTDSRLPTSFRNANVQRSSASRPDSATSSQ